MAFVLRTWTGFTSVDDALAKVKQALIDAGWTDMSYGSPTVHMLATAVVATKEDRTQCRVYMELRKETVSGVDVLNCYFWQNPNKTGSSHGFGLPITANTISTTFNFYANEYWFAIYSTSYTQNPTCAGAYVPFSGQSLDNFAVNPWWRVSYRDATANTFNRATGGFSYTTGNFVNYVNVGVSGWAYGSSGYGFMLVYQYIYFPPSIYSDSSNPNLLYLYPTLAESQTINSKAVGCLPYGGVTLQPPQANLGDTQTIGNFTFQAIAKDFQGCVLWGRVQ
jgi:hypothetical protein